MNNFHYLWVFFYFLFLTLFYSTWSPSFIIRSPWMSRKRKETSKGNTLCKGKYCFSENVRWSFFAVVRESILMEWWWICKMTNGCLFLVKQCSFQNVKYSFLCPLANKVLCGCTMWYVVSTLPGRTRGALMRHLKQGKEKVLPWNCARTRPKTVPKAAQWYWI